MFDNGSYYGAFRTRTFADIFNNAEEFKTTYEQCELPNLLRDENSITTIYYLLYAKYGNAPIASSDEERFKYAVFSIIFMYGPSWEKRLEIQNKVRGLTEADIIAGGKAIYNSALNPSGAPSTGSTEELNTINQQNTTNYKKSKLEAYATLMSLIRTDVTEEFIGKFKNLFLKILAPDRNLWYVTRDEEED